MFPKRRQPFALLVSTLHCLSPSPAVSHVVVYNEPFFALTSFVGMWMVLRRQWLVAAIAFGAGCLFRGQGVVLGPGFFGWFFFLQSPFGVSLNVCLPSPFRRPARTTFS